MSKTYVLKSWDEVNDHHFISRKRWDELCEGELDADFLDGILSTTAIITPKGAIPTLGNSFMVSKDDLRECVQETPTENSESVKEKTYTVNDVREAAMRVMVNIADENDAVVSALAIAKLIKELN